MCNHTEKNIQVLKWSLGVFSGIAAPSDLSAMAENPHTWPKSHAPVIIANGAANSLVAMRWGVWPFYARDRPHYVTNARSDGLLAKATWKESAARRRCLVPVSGYYEPGLGPPGARGEVRFGVRDQPGFFIAGLWDTDPDASGESGYALVTSEPNDYAKPFHDRMPVVLSDSAARRWIGNTPLPADELLALCQPCRPEILVHREISAVPKGKISKADLSAQSGELFR